MYRFARTIVEYVDMLKSTVPHDVIARYVAPYYILRGNSILSKPEYRTNEQLVSDDELKWLTNEIRERQLKHKGVYDWHLLQAPYLLDGKLEFHYKPTRSMISYFLQFNSNMTLADLDAAYNQLNEEHRIVHVVDPLSTVFSNRAKSSDLRDYKVVCDEKQDDVIASASEEPSILQQALDAHNSGEEE